MKYKTTRGKGSRLSKLSYLAGIIDGEGSISVTHHIRHTQGNHEEYRLRFYVVNTDKRLIDWIKNNFGGLVYSRKNYQNPQWKLKWEWIMEGVKIDSFLKEIIPFLIIKKEQAKIALKFRKTIGTGKRISEANKKTRKDLFFQVKKLNNREWLAAETKRIYT